METLPKIEKGIPVPPRAQQLTRFPKANLLRAMKKGDSIFVDSKQKNVRQSWRSSAEWCGFRIITRKEGDGFRLWRGEDI